MVVERRAKEHCLELARSGSGLGANRPSDGLAWLDLGTARFKSSHSTAGGPLRARKRKSRAFYLLAISTATAHSRRSLARGVSRYFSGVR